VLLETGANIPCDCLVLEAYDLKISQMVDDVEEEIIKRPVENDHALE
jgi:hypothetical protein